MAPEGAWHLGQRMALLDLVARGTSVKEAAEAVGLSRQKAHKWLRRAELGGLAALADRSRARKSQARFSGQSLELLIQCRREHGTWGARQLLGQIRKKHPRLALPAASTLHEVLRARGLVRRRKRTRRCGPLFPPQRAEGPNDIWTIDFKGQFRLGDGVMCYPLTIRDAFSRKVLRVVACTNTRHETVLRILKETFEEHGLPRAIHSDTGAPFGSTGIGRLSQLSLFMLDHGVLPTFSRPGKPQDNGAHERMHRDLKAETALPPAANMKSQQRRFDEFVRCFNGERLHQALQMRTPNSVWRTSPRRFRAKPRTRTQPRHWETRSVDSSGKFGWNTRHVFLSHALRHRPISLEPVADRMWRIHYAGIPIAFITEGENTTRIDELERGYRPPALATLASAGRQQHDRQHTNV